MEWQIKFPWTGNSFIKQKVEPSNFHVFWMLSMLQIVTGQLFKVHGENVQNIARQLALKTLPLSLFFPVSLEHWFLDCLLFTGDSGWVHKNLGWNNCILMLGKTLRLFVTSKKVIDLHSTSCKNNSHMRLWRNGSSAASSHGLHVISHFKSFSFSWTVLSSKQNNWFSF